jgi:hypothetical protein
LRGLHGARTAPDARDFGPASEACLGLAEIAAQLEARRRRLAAVSELDDPLALFDDLASAALRGARRRVGGTLVEPEFRTLSPSDFGFHNALRRAGRLVFFDFEYFGWDDPVKAVADFLWHPAMSLGSAARERFRTGAGAIYAADPAFEQRLAAFLPLYGLRWSLIVLNEFLPERWARRVAAGTTDDHMTVKIRQREKATALLAEVRSMLADATS